MKANDELNSQVVRKVEVLFKDVFADGAAISTAVWKTARGLGSVLINLKGALA